MSDDTAAMRFVRAAEHAVAAMRRADAQLTMFHATIERALCASTEPRVRDDLRAVVDLMGTARDALASARGALEIADNESKAEAEQDGAAVVDQLDQALTVYHDIMSRARPGGRE